ncbi:MAG: ABC-type multidrug transport system, ATPase component [Candidatus Collierbacteria bacterium GW2011_GWF2_44_15]|nr:MAG: ABC-type multidrug transport system, ATPase component [Candidatus Collierbacteria bacterium GW2011_GWF2_44_15]KKT98954.1 MAG: ABC-type multidrug transport system, ATPase component [Candidatus Collierbacteria bacterium GW2011_GWC2_45_15]KKU29217.1 MAG: ABC-type multidrug transport system, ATPase component [Candidatus Collierbacteria bacterium GW2011_GWE1_46_18]
MNQLAILHVENVSKSFGKLHALRSVSFDVRPKEIYALIGPNGSGKTTLINNIVGLLKPDNGEITIAGIDINQKPITAKALLGYVPDNPANYPFLTGMEFLYLTARLKHLSQAEIDKEVGRLKDIFPIEDVLNTPMAGYSRGSLQKTAFLASLLGDPKLLVIDEPVVGLDPLSIKIFGEKLQQFSKSGGSVFLSTHTLTFAHKYADRVGIIHEGKLIHEVGDPKKVDLEKMYEKEVHTAYV